MVEHSPQMPPPFHFVRIPPPIPPVIFAVPTLLLFLLCPSPHLSLLVYFCFVFFLFLICHICVVC